MTTSRSRWLLACLLASGCAYRAQLLSDPDGARLRLPRGLELVGGASPRNVVAPVEVVVPGSPLGRHVVRVTADGYRTLPVDLADIESGVLRQIEVAFTGNRRREITFVLVEEHPPVGTREPSE